MVSPQLLDYIRQQFAAGIPKEEISKSLIASSWQVSDINEAFASISPSPSTQMPVQNFVQPTASSHKGMMAVVIVLLLLVGAGGAFAAYHYGIFTSPVTTTTPPTTPTTTTSILPVANGMTRYNSDLFGVTIDYDPLQLFEHSSATMADGLYSIEQFKSSRGLLNFGSDAAVGSPNAYKYSAYSLTWQYYQYPGDLQQTLAQYCAPDTKYYGAVSGRKIEPQTLTISDGSSIQGCHIATFGGTVNKPETQIAQVIYFVEHPVTKRIIEFHTVENFSGGGQDTEVQKLYKQGDDLMRTVSLYSPSQAGLDLLKKMDDTKNILQINPNKDATTTISQGVGSYKDNSLGIEVHFPSPTWYYKPSVLLSTENTSLHLSWRYLFANDTDLKKFQNCTTNNTPGELHMLTAGNTKIYECISASEKSAGGAWDVSFMLQHPTTNFYIVFWGNDNYSLQMSQRAGILTTFENIVTGTTFFQPSSDALKQAQIMHDQIVSPSPSSPPLRTIGP